MSVDIFGHLAYGLITLSFLFRSMIWLRSLSVIASAASMAYNYNVSAGPLWVPIQWNVLFVAINMFQIGLILYDLRKVKLNPLEQDIYEHVFSVMRKVDFLKVFNSGYIRKVEDGATLITQGQVMDAVMLITKGEVRVSIDEKEVAILGKGKFFGEMSFLTNENATATIKAKGPAQYIIWDQVALKELLCSQTQLVFPLQQAMGVQFKEKLLGPKETLPQNQVA